MITLTFSHFCFVSDSLDIEVLSSPYLNKILLICLCALDDDSERSELSLHLKLLP